MPAMLRSKQVAGYPTNDASATLSHEVEQGPRPSSRLASFAPFRRSTMLSSSAGPPSPTNSFGFGNYPARSGAFADGGGVGDVPVVARPTVSSSHSSSSSMSKAPSKPPKPAALRVKKAKALSISLLSNHSSSSNSSAAHTYVDRHESKNDKRRPQPASSIAVTPPRTLQEALAAEDRSGGRYPHVHPSRQHDAIPPRSASALDYYQANGPTKGLASKEWPIQRRTNDRNFDRALNDAQYSVNAGIRADAKQLNNDQLFIIGRDSTTDEQNHQEQGYPSIRHERRRSASLSLDASTSPDQGNEKLSNSSTISKWNLDTARELLSEADRGAHLTADQDHGNASRIAFRTSPRSAASPFLNTYNAQAKMQQGVQNAEHGGTAHRTTDKVQRPSSSSSSSGAPSSPSQTARFKAVGNYMQHHHLGKADILRSTHRASTDSFSSDLSPQVPSSPLRSSYPLHPIDSSASPKQGKKRPNMRQRAQSHAFGALKPPDQTLQEDRAIPQHPLSAQASTFSERNEVREYKHHTNGRKDTDGNLPPPTRKNPPMRVQTHDDLSSQPHTRIEDPRLRAAAQTQANGTALHNIGQQIGGMGAAVGKRGWDMFKQWGASTGQAQGRRMPDASRRVSMLSTANDATRTWLGILDGTVVAGKTTSSPGHHGDGVFGCPLREAVLLTRLGSTQSVVKEERQITTLDLGTEFKIDLPAIDDSADASKQKSSIGLRQAVGREKARMKYLPGVVVRCIEAIEVWGVEEEGIYRLSGRASHTTKLRQVFHAFPGRQPVTDLRLVDVGTAELDLNSVTSLLKAYLRELPDSLIPEPHATNLNSSLQQKCGITAVGVSPNFGFDGSDNINAIKAVSKSTTTDEEQKAEMGKKIADAVSGPLRALSAANWYLLRELAMHLGDMTRPEVVKQTRMPLSNLCLILAPTLSLSVPMVRAMVEHREAIFGGEGPSPDVELDRLSVSSSIAPSSSRLPLPLDFSSPRLALPRGQKSSPIENDKRISLATVTDKRRSTSSVATVQPSSRGGGVSQTMREQLLARSLIEEDDPTLLLSPIAAKFIRQRTDSSAGSIDGASVDLEGAFVVGQRRPSDHSATIAVADNESNGGDSSGPPSNDGFSSAASSFTPSANGHIAMRSHSALALSNHDGLPASGSSTSVHSALDRPRPPTGTSARFLSFRPSAGGGSSSGVGGGGASKRMYSKRTGSDATMSAHSSSSSLSGGVTSHVRNDDAPPGLVKSIGAQTLSSSDDGDKTARASPVTEKFVDDAPMDVKAIRQWWSDRRGG